MSTRIWAVVPAGGSGSRMNATVPKQYLLLNGAPILHHTLNRLSQVESIAGLVVGIARGDEYWQKSAFIHPKLVATVEAGEHRVDTVLNCLLELEKRGASTADDWALVHDAARPCVRPDEIARLMNTCLRERSGGILALALSDTIKRAINVDGSLRVKQTVSRDNLWRAMTPQLFKISDLLAAIQSAKSNKLEITDEASAMEAAGFQPLIVPCSSDNIKITYPEDLRLAEMILAVQKSTATQ